MTKGALRNKVRHVYYFLPVQLVILHFRKYQLLLLFWLMLVATLTGHFAAHFGAATLFLAPEYFGNVSFYSMLLLGGAMGVFIMSWHITTFIINAHRIPYMGAARQTFLVYVINNSIIPLAFLIFYSVVSIHFQWYYEHADVKFILVTQAGFYLGLLLVVLLSFAYFFRVGRDLLKTVLTTITNPARIRDIIPYDALDYEVDIIRVDNYITETFRVAHCDELERYHPRMLNAVLRRHHRNAIAATVFAVVLLFLLGIFMDQPLLRIPAAAGFLILFAIMMGVVGAVKYFLRSWEVLGWVVIGLVLSALVSRHVFDLRSIAYGLNYHTSAAGEPVYDYEHLKDLFNTQRYERDKKTEEARLDKWKTKRDLAGVSKPPLVVITISGGGSRAAYWAFRSMQYADSITGQKLFSNTVLISGASGGMMGAAYWRSVHSAYNDGIIKDPYDEQYLANIGKDLLNAIIFSFASVDLINPFNKISIEGHSYTKDRGYAMEHEMVNNMGPMIDKTIGDFKQKEADADIPQMIFNGTIINDGRKLMMAAQPISYLGRPGYSLRDTVDPPIDAIDFAAFFERQNPYNLRITSAIRMNATFPFVLPVVKLPSKPVMNIMDAGMRDNFGTEIASRYLFVMRRWIEENAGNVIFLEIRDTREGEMFPPAEQHSLSSMISDPLFVIQNKWEVFQSYYHGYLKDFAPYFLNGKLRFVTLEYVPEEKDRSAALNFHLTQKEKMDIYRSIYYPRNQAAFDTLQSLLK
ncbi:MAG: hypothetical protein BGO69_07070 [Bacteroidetes bacterium 46-16]|nr:MAG: hypothetical protein BGO69_07070 [Bacteroidetes bacterium 46-16]